MTRMKRRAGMTLIELLIVTFILIISGLALVGFIQITYGAQDTISGQNSADATARQVLDVLADNIRNSQWYNTGNPNTSCAIMVSAALSTDITIYNQDPTTTLTDGTEYTRYWLSGTDLNRAVTAGGATTTTTILTGVQSLAFNYYSSADYKTAITPASSDYPLLGAVEIAATVSTTQLKTYTRQYTSRVRLRNSPPPT